MFKFDKKNAKRLDVLQRRAIRQASKQQRKETKAVKKIAAATAPAAVEKKPLKKKQLKQEKEVVSKKKKQKNKDTSPPPIENFLTFLHTQRAIIVNTHKDRQALQFQLVALDAAILAAPTTQQRNNGKRERLRIQEQIVKISHISTVEQYDRKLAPFLVAHYRHDAIVINHEELLQLYKREFQGHAPIIQNIADTCPKCSSEYLESEEDAILMCPVCAEATPYMDSNASSVAYGDEVDYTPFSYRRINHLSEFLNHFQAKESAPVPESTMNLIMQKLRQSGVTDPRNITFNEVKMVQKTLALRKTYDNTMQIWCRLTGNKPVRLDPICEEKIRLMFLRVQAPFKRICPSSRKNFLSYPYVLFKFVQMLGYYHLMPYFSLLKSKEKLQVQESIFKAICDDIGWAFVPIRDEDCLLI